jgi:hypothetical protein
MPGFIAPGDLVKPNIPRSHHESPVMINPAVNRMTAAQIGLVVLPSPSALTDSDSFAAGQTTNQLHRVPEAAAPAYLRRRAAWPEVLTTTEPCAAASTSPITARAADGRLRDHPPPCPGPPPWPPSTAASKVEDERVPPLPSEPGGHGHRGQRRRQPQMSPAAAVAERASFVPHGARGLLPPPPRPPQGTTWGQVGGGGREGGRRAAVETPSGGGA